MNEWLLWSQINTSLQHLCALSVHAPPHYYFIVLGVLILGGVCCCCCVKKTCCKKKTSAAPVVYQHVSTDGLSDRLLFIVIFVASFHINNFVSIAGCTSTSSPELPCCTACLPSILSARATRQHGIHEPSSTYTTFLQNAGKMFVFIKHPLILSRPAHSQEFVSFTFLFELPVSCLGCLRYNNKVEITQQLLSLNHRDVAAWWPVNSEC